MEPTLQKTDKRGQHWQFRTDRPPVGERTRFWSEENKKMEVKIVEYTRISTLPWYQSRNTRPIGFQAKCIYMHLFICDREGIIKITWADKSDNTNFFGIKGFIVLDLASFNDGMFPLPSGWKSYEGVRFQAKSLITVWQGVGLVEQEGGITETHDGVEKVYKGMLFDSYRKDLIKQRYIRAEAKRWTKLHTPSAAKPAAVAAETPAAVTTTLAPIDQTVAVATTTLAPIDQTVAAPQTLPGPLTLLSLIASEQAAVRDEIFRAKANYDAAFIELQRAQLRFEASNAALQAAYAKQKQMTPA